VGSEKVRGSVVVWTYCKCINVPSLFGIGCHTVAGSRGKISVFLVHFTLPMVKLQSTRCLLRSVQKSIFAGFMTGNSLPSEPPWVKWYY